MWRSPQDARKRRPFAANEHHIIGSNGLDRSGVSAQAGSVVDKLRTVLACNPPKHPPARTPVCRS